MDKKEFKNNKNISPSRAKAILEYCTQLWYDTWKNQGAVDEGTCCGGKKIETDYGNIPCNFVQGNVSAMKSAKPVMSYLSEVWGIESYYNDGWMD